MSRNSHGYTCFVVCCLSVCCVNITMNALLFICWCLDDCFEDALLFCYLNLSRNSYDMCLVYCVWCCIIESCHAVTWLFGVAWSCLLIMVCLCVWLMMNLVELVNAMLWITNPNAVWMLPRKWISIGCFCCFSMRVLFHWKWANHNISIALPYAVRFN